jgi:myosin heavy subunit
VHAFVIDEINTYYHARTGNKIAKDLSVDDAVNNRNAVSKSVYNGVFNWYVLVLRVV